MASSSISQQERAVQAAEARATEAQGQLGLHRLRLGDGSGDDYEHHIADYEHHMSFKASASCTYNLFDGMVSNCSSAAVSVAHTQTHHLSSAALPHCMEVCPAHLMLHLAPALGTNATSNSSWLVSMKTGGGKTGRGGARQRVTARYSARQRLQRRASDVPYSLSFPPLVA